MCVVVGGVDAPLVPRVWVWLVLDAVGHRVLLAVFHRQFHPQCGLLGREGGRGGREGEGREGGREEGGREGGRMGGEGGGGREKVIEEKVRG